LVAPLDPASLLAAFAEIMAHAAADFTATGLKGPMAVERWVEFRYRRQTHELRVPWTLDPTDPDDLDGLIADFERRYEGRYGPGTGYAAAGIESTAVGVAITAPRARDRAEAPRAAPYRARSATPAGQRAVYFERWVTETPVYRGAALEPGHLVAGPAVVDWPATTLVIHPGQEASVGATGDVILRLDGRGGR
jgi:N-methylhydantoinase A